MDIEMVISTLYYIPRIGKDLQKDVNVFHLLGS